jgi:hypothetical protein
MHIDDAMIRRLVDGELAPAQARSVSEHASECETCGSRVDLVRNEDSAMLDLLESLDHPVPSTSAAEVIRASRRARSAAWRRAAMIPLLVLGAAGTAYALPGTPVRAWLEDMFGDDTSAERAAGQADALSPEPEPTGGLAVDPGRSMVVLLEDPAPGGVIEASLYDGPFVEATAHGGTASFASDEGRITVRGGDRSTRLVVRVPRNAAHVEIRVEGRTVFVKMGEAVSVPAAAAAGDGVWTIPVDAPSVGAGR